MRGPTASSRPAGRWRRRAPGRVSLSTGPPAPQAAVTTDGGLTWSLVATTADTQYLEDLSCPSATQCVAVGWSDNNFGESESTTGTTSPVGGLLDVGELVGGANPAEACMACALKALGLDQLVSDPVNTATGDLFESYTDLQVPTFGPPLAFTRTYDSSVAQSEAASGTPGPLGYGWTDDYAASLVVQPSGDVAVTQEDGAQVSFVPPSQGACPSGMIGPGTSGTYCAPPRVMATLTYSPGNATYVFSRQTDHLTLTFAASSGRLLSEADPVGNTLEIEYSTPTPGSSGCPSTAASCETILAASGRALTLGWSGAGDSGTVTSVTDPAGRTYIYAYCQSGESGCSSGDLVSVTDPKGDLTTFTYDSSNGTTSLRHDLLTVTAPDQQPSGSATSFGYDSSGRVTSVTDPMQRVTRFSYSGDPSSATGGTTLVTDPDGNETLYGYVYDALVSEVDDYGTAAESRKAYQRDAGSLLPIEVENGDGELTELSYDGSGNVTGKLDPPGAGGMSSAVYNALGEPLCISTALATPPSDPNYDGDLCAYLQASGELPKTQTAGGTITPAAGSGSGVPPPYVTYDDYDSSGNLLYQTTGIYSGSPPTLLGVRTTYDLYSGDKITLDGQLVQCVSTPPAADLACATIAAPNSTSTTVAPPVTQVGYDSSGDVSTRTLVDSNGAANAVTTFGYDADGEPTSTTSPLGNVAGADAALYTTTTAYDADGETTSTTNGLAGTVLGETTATSYDAGGNATGQTNSLFEQTSTAYDTDNEPVLVTNPDGDKSLTCYDGDGNVAQTVPPVGVAAKSLGPSSCPTSAPWGFGVPLAPDATETSYAFTNPGEVVTTESPAPEGQSGTETTARYYDAAGRLVETVAPPIGVSAGYDTGSIDTYDTNGELLSATTGLSVATATGAVATTVVTSTTSYCYDAGGDRTAAMPGDANTAVTVSPSGTVSGFVTCGSSGTVSNEYATTYGYDSVGDVVSTTRPVTASSTAVTKATFFPDGSLETSISPLGVTTTDSYVPAGALASESYSDGEATVSLAYDVAGERTTMTDAASVSGSSTAYAYDPAGRLVYTINEAGQATGYGYDAAGDLTAISYPLPAASWITNDTAEYGYDAAGELTSVGDFAGRTIAVTNNPDGLPATEALPTATPDTVTTSYDNTDRVLSTALAPTSDPTHVLNSFGYAYKPPGEVAEEDDAGFTSYSPQIYTYNAGSRIHTDTAGPEPEQTYSTDASGNLTTLPGNIEALYQPGSELCWSAAGTPSGTCTSPPSGSTSYAYNADGDLTGESGAATVTASWDGKDQLGSYSDSAASMTSATYDGDGLRVADTVGGNSQGFVWDLVSGSAPRLLSDGTNAYIYGGGTTPAEQVALASGTPSYLLTDALGSVRSVVDTSGAVDGSTAYDAWGSPWNSAGGLTSLTPFGFAGGYTDASGLVYLLHRYYDPSTGQFLSVDPLVDVTGQPYAYVRDDPVNTTDPSGEDWIGTGSGNCVQTSDPAVAECPILTSNGLTYPNCGTLHEDAVPPSTCTTGRAVTWRSICSFGLNITSYLAGGVSAVTAVIPGLEEISSGAALVAFLADLTSCLALHSCAVGSLLLDGLSLIPGGASVRFANAAARDAAELKVLEFVGKVDPSLKANKEFKELAAKLAGMYGAGLSGSGVVTHAAGG